MKYLFYKKIYLALLIFGFFPFISFASELRLDSNKVDVKVGEDFVVQAMLFADTPINAIEGKVIFPGDMLIIKEISDGNSSINFWIERPQMISPGIIAFSGITPGGFSGVNNLIFYVTFKAKKTGVASIYVGDEKALQNDGIGTETSLALRNVSVEIKSGDSSSPQKEKMEDSVLPEPFSLSIARDIYVDNEKWFVVFATSDKDTGVSRYEIKEYRFPLFAFLKPWRVVESPYILSDQTLKSNIVVRAVDGAHNKRITQISATYPLLWYEHVFYWFILTSVVCGVLYVFSKIWKRKI